MNYEYISSAQIKKAYHLDELCPSNTAQKENIASAIRSVYFYMDIMKALENTNDEEMKAINRKTIMILSYSVIDGIVACLGFKMQNRCYNCKKPCSHYCIGMFAESEKKNVYNSFKNADEFLRKIKVINLDRNANIFYKHYREIRNNVHLTSNSKVITRDTAYSKNQVCYATDFMDSFIKMLYRNYINFINANNCIRRGGI